MLKVEIIKENETLKKDVVLYKMNYEVWRGRQEKLLVKHEDLYLEFVAAAFDRDCSRRERDHLFEMCLEGGLITREKTTEPDIEIF